MTEAQPVQYSPWNPRGETKTSSPALGKIFDEHIYEHYDDFTKADDSTFKALGKYHVEPGTMPTKLWDSAELPNNAFDWAVILPPPTTTIIPIEGEELYKSPIEEERNRFVCGLQAALDEHGKFFLEGAAGTGKSSYVKALIKRNPTVRYVILSPYGSLIEKVWKGYNCMTDAKAFGQIVDSNGGLEQQKKGIDFGDLGLLVVDEAYLVQLDNVFKIKRLMNKYPALKVIFLGCEFQNDCVVIAKANSVDCQPIAETLKEVFARMFPYRVVLRINKRSPEDQEAYEAIHRMLFEEHRTPKELMAYLISKNWIGGVIRDEDSIIKSRITTHISPFNRMAIRLNKLVHCGIYRQPYKFEVADGTYFLRRDTTMKSGKLYRTGERCRIRAIDAAGFHLTFEQEEETVSCHTIQRMIAANRYRDTDMKGFLIQPIGEYVLRAYNKGLIRNTSVFLTVMPTKQTKDCYKFRQSAEAIAAEEVKAVVSIKKDRVDFKTFRLPYARTGHSCQGDTIYEKYCIHDIGAFCVSAKWIWTALTRAVSLKNVYIYMSSEEQSEPSMKNFDDLAARRLKCYIDSDRATNRYERDDAYDVRGMAKLAQEAHGRRCQGLCGESCDSVMDYFSDGGEAISFDRINNDRGHAIDNLRCVCLSCNCWAQDRDDE